MSSVAIQLTSPNGSAVSGIMIGDLKIGRDFILRLPGNEYFQVDKVRGWIGAVNSGKATIFGIGGVRFTMKLLASSDQFLL